MTAGERILHPAEGRVGVRPLYARQLLTSFGAGTVGPFITVYAISLGASPAQLGLLQAVLNIAPTVFQLPWGRLSDRVGRRSPFLVIGGAISSLIWLPVAYAASPDQLILLISVQAVVGSMAIPAWTALIGDTVPPNVRGTLTASLNMWAGIGSLFATLLSGYLLITSQDSRANIFLLPFTLATVLGVASVLPLLTIRSVRCQASNTNRFCLAWST